eukprot:1656378-Prymnesium_polylepis.1
MPLVLRRGGSFLLSHGRRSGAAPRPAWRPGRRRPPGRSGSRSRHSRRTKLLLDTNRYDKT